MERQDLKPQVAGLRIPTFKVTWDEEVSPFVEQAEARMVEWANRYNLLVDEHYRKRVDRTRYGWLAARVWPLAEPELLQVLCDFMLWFFLVDDLFVDRVETITDDTLRNLTAMIDVLDFDRAGPEPVWGELAWVDICDRLRRLLPSEVFERFAQGMRLWATCAALQILNHLRPKPVGMREYQTIRRHTSGMNPCIALSGMVGAEEYYRPEVQKLMMHTNNIVCWANDIQSLAIEISQPGQYRNMVVIHTMKGCDLQEAVDWTAAQVDGEIKAFTELADAVSKDASASAALIEFVTGMKYWIRGYLDWVALDTKRYATEYVAHDADDRHISLAV